MSIIVLCVLAGLFLLYMFLTERRHQIERRELYHRIQAPQQVINEIAAEQVTAPLETYVPVDDDESFHRYKASRS